MILKYKYHSDTGLLEAYRSYTLAQNNSLSDTIVITSTATDAERYNYCLEFICYNSKSIPKAQYISPILNYNDCIEFALPNNLTEFRGHVDMQLTGYDPDDNSVVFKSISKNCKAFDVEGSLCVLEKDLNDTPNVFTEVLKQLQDLKDIHQDIIDEAMTKFSNQIFEMVAKYRWHKVTFYDAGKVLAQQWIAEGNKLTKPSSYTLPNRCVIVGSGWYNSDTESMWDFESDTVQGETNLHLNYMSSGVVISQGVVVSLGNTTRSTIYVPEYFDGYKVCSVLDTINYVPYESYIHLGNNMENFDILLTNSNVLGLYFPANNPYIISEDGFLYVEQDGYMILAFAPKLRGDQDSYNFAIKNGCIAISTMAVNNNSALEKLNLPTSMQTLKEKSITGTGLKELTLPSGVHNIEHNAIYNNFDLKKIILEGDCSSVLTDESFVNVDYKGNVTRPKLCVYPQHYLNYKARGLAYEFEVMGQEYYDQRYMSKEV